MNKIGKCPYSAETTHGGAIVPYRLWGRCTGFLGVVDGWHGNCKVYSLTGWQGEGAVRFNVDCGLTGHLNEFRGRGTDREGIDMAKTLQARFIAGLEARGWRNSGKHYVGCVEMVHDDSGNLGTLYVGKGGSLRMGRNRTTSQPCSNKTKARLLDAFNGREGI